MRFKVFDRMLAALSGLLIVVLGLAAIVLGTGLLPVIDFSFLNGPFELWQKIAIIGGGVVLFLLGLHGLHMLFRRRYSKNFIVQRTDMGDMSIAISALHNMVNKCVEQHQEICVKKIDINRVRGGIVVDLKILLANGINIPLTANVLQKQIKQYITSCSGIDVHEVRVQIGTSDKAVKAKKKPVAALEQAPAVVALQDQTENAADSILQHTEEPSDYVETLEYVEPVSEIAASPAEEADVYTEVVEETVVESSVNEEPAYTEAVPEVAEETAVFETGYAEPVVDTVEEVVYTEQTVPAVDDEAPVPEVEALAEQPEETAVEAAEEETIINYDETVREEE